MLRWYPSALLRVVLEITFVPVAFLTIFALMVLFRPDTPWSIGTWSGPGASPDFWKVVALLAVGWTLIVLGWRGAGPVFKASIVAWHAALTAASVLHVLAEDDLFVRGEAVGFSLSLRLLAPAISAFALVCALVWIARDRGSRAGARPVSPLRRRNVIAALLAGIALAVGGLALVLDAEEIGVVACLAAVLAAHEVVRPLNPSAVLHDALVGEGSALE